MKNKLFRESMEDLINDYFDKHKSAKEVGSEYVYQNDGAQLDAIKLVADICDTYISIFSEV